jgi:hypothetical protein
MNIEFPLVASSVDNDHTIRVQFGDFCCALICHDADIFQRLKESYRVFQSNKPADVDIKLKFINRLDPAKIEAILSRVSALPTKDHYKAVNQVFYIQFDPTSHTFLLTADKCIFDTCFKLKPMNHLFRFVYYTMSELKHQDRPPEMLVHTCGILRNGQALLFAGPSGTGKSTIGRLCSEDYGLTLNDEMVLISWPNPHNCSLWVHSVPIFGELPFRLNTSAPLASVLMLKQSKKVAIRRLNRREAYLRFLYQIISPVAFNQTDKRAIFSLVAEFADEVTKVTPFYELEFSLDRNLLWEVEAKLTELNRRED